MKTLKLIVTAILAMLIIVSVAYADTTETVGETPSIKDDNEGVIIACTATISDTETQLYDIEPMDIIKYVTCSNLNVRSVLNDLGSEIVNNLSFNTQVHVTEYYKDINWYYSPDLNGYISGEFLSDAEQKGEFIGKKKITFYCPCATCNPGNPGRSALCKPLVVGQSSAMGRSYPLGSLIYIEGIGFRIVDDRGVPNSTVDVCVASHAEAYKLGVRYCNVYLVRSGF